VPRILAALLATVLVASLTACASVDDALGDAADAGASAAGSAAIAAGLHTDGRALTPFTDTVLADAVGELTDASRTVLELTPDDPDDETARDAVERALRDGIDAVTGARAALARGDDLGPWVDRLEATRDALAKAAP
jgi:hypothetical protein